MEDNYLIVRWITITLIIIMAMGYHQWRHSKPKSQTSQTKPPSKKD